MEQEERGKVTFKIYISFLCMEINDFKIKAVNYVVFTNDIGYHMLVNVLKVL